MCPQNHVGGCRVDTDFFARSVDADGQFASFNIINAYGPSVPQIRIKYNEASI
jgi:hypothetical protein